MHDKLSKRLTQNSWGIIQNLLAQNVHFSCSTSHIEQKQQQKTCAKKEWIVRRLLHNSHSSHACIESFRPPQSLKNPLSLFIHCHFVLLSLALHRETWVCADFEIGLERDSLGFKLHLDLMHILYLNASTFMILRKMCRFYAKWRWMQTHRLIRTTWHLIFMSSSEKNA